MKDKDTLAVASLPHNIINRRGFVSPGNRVLKAFQECEQSSIRLQVIRTFTEMEYSAPLNNQKARNQTPRPNN